MGGYVPRKIEKVMVEMYLGPDGQQYRSEIAAQEAHLHNDLDLLVESVKTRVTNGIPHVFKQAMLTILKNSSLRGDLKNLIQEFEYLCGDQQEFEYL